MEEMNARLREHKAEMAEKNKLKEDLLRLEQKIDKATTAIGATELVGQVQDLYKKAAEK